MRRWVGARGRRGRVLASSRGYSLAVSRMGLSFHPDTKREYDDVCVLKCATPAKLSGGFVRKCRDLSANVRIGVSLPKCTLERLFVSTAGDRWMERQAFIENKPIARSGARR